jgi:Asp/Glu/hydantoin racemase
MVDKGSTAGGEVEIQVLRNEEASAEEGSRKSDSVCVLGCAVMSKARERL